MPVVVGAAWDSVGLCSCLAVKQKGLTGSPSQMEGTVALFVARREGFFAGRVCINCPVDTYCACENASFLFDVDGVMRKKLVDVGEGVRISEPVVVVRGLVAGNDILASLSHQGVLAIYDSWSVQFTNLNSNRQVKMEVEGESLADFYDNKVLLLTLEKPLREVTVERVFDNPSIATLEEIEGPGNVFPCTDVSMLHVRRTLYYPTMNNKLFSFNVDTRMNVEINVEENVWYIASFTGINCEVKAVFQSSNNYIHTLNMDDTITRVAGRPDYTIMALLPSTSNPENIENSLFIYFNHLVKDRKEIDTHHLIKFYGDSTIRVYRDIFLTYDNKTESWVLVRIIVP